MARRGRQRTKRTPRLSAGRQALLWFGLLGVSTSPAWAQEGQTVASPEPPRERMRINPTGNDIVLVLPVRQNGRIIGQLNTSIGADDTVTVPVSELVELLRPRVRDEVIAQIEGARVGETVSTTDLRAASGAIITFNPQTVELDLQLPSSAMAPIEIDLVGGGRSALNVETPDPEPFSLALNYRGTLDFVEESSYRDIGVNTPIIDFDLLGRVGAIAHESEFFYDERVAEEVVRQGSRLIVDQPENFRRWTAGDLFVETTGFQSAPDVAGLSVSHLAYDFPNSELAQVRGRQTFSIDRPSRVEIFINGQPQLDMQLQPGFYDLRNFPFVTGANDVQVVIEDATGQRQVLQFDYFLEGTLLAPGQSEYYAAAGVRSEFLTDSREYFEDEPIGTGFFRYGVNDRLTFGASLQVSDTARVAGGEATLAPSVGLLHVSFADSDIDGVGAGQAARADYRWTFRNAEKLPRTFSASFEARTELFGSLNEPNPSNPYDYTLAVRYSHSLTETLSASAGFVYSHARENEDEYIASANAGVSYSLSANTRVSLGVAYDREATGEEEVSGSIFLNHRIGQRHYTSAAYNSRDERLNLNYTYLSSGGIGSVDGTAGYTRVPSGSSANAAINYTASRARVGLAQNIATDQDEEVIESATSLRADGALAFTDGRFAIGHSLSDSFVILSPHESLDGAAIEVGDPRNDLVIAKSGALGPALVGVSSYTPNVIAYNVPDAPLGYDLGLASITVNLPLHGANAITVGSDYNITAVGILVDYAGEPVRLQAARAVRLDEPDAVEVEIFTNRNGRFGGSGLAPGRWEIRTVTGTPLRYVVTIAPGGDTLLTDVGTLQPVQ